MPVSRPHLLACCAPLAEFTDNGQREITSRRALRKIAAQETL